MKKIVAGLLAILLAAACVGCGKAEQQEEGGAEPAPVIEGGVAVQGDPENPIKLYLDDYSAACAAASNAADEAAGKDDTLLSELLGMEGHVYALQTLLYGPANLIYTSENLYDGGIYGLQHGTGSVWQTEEEVSFSCTLDTGDMVAGILSGNVLEARQTLETAGTEEVPSVTLTIRSGMIKKAEDGWYSYCWRESENKLSMLYVGKNRMVFAQRVNPALREQDAWLNTPPEDWGESCLLVEEGKAAVYRRESGQP